jgi:molybdopterin-guanine dinucleotide biosynthesis protein A
MGATVPTPRGGRVAGAVIAGGRSRRLGTDKRFAEVDGRTLLVRTLDVLEPLVTDLHVIVADAEDRELVMGATTARSPLPITVSVDHRPGEGPAGGLETALRVARLDLTLVVATDHPWLSAGVLALLIEHARTMPGLAVALEGPYGAEPLLAVYHRDALPTVTDQLDRGVRRMQQVLAALEPDVIPIATWQRHDPTVATLRDVDEPGDLTER